MHIFVPSTARAHLERLKRGPLAGMLPETRSSTTYVVYPEESSAYKASLDALGWSSQGTSIVECPARGIASKRQFIGGQAKKRKLSKFLMLDDDIHWLIRKSPDAWHMRYARPEEVAALMERISRLLDNYGHVGVSSREGNNRLGVGSPDELVVENVRTQRALAYRTVEFLSVEHCRVPVMEDFDVNLQLLKLGIPNANIGYWAQGQQMTNAPGGCSTFRTREVHEQAARTLAELHPGLVRLRVKSNKTDADGFGSRVEVTVRWKAALRPKSGLLF
jgi:hypothetical protein